MIIKILIASILGYFIGAFPSAYVLMKKRGVDITQEGTGNVGAMNTFRIGSKGLGVAVFFLDFIKGFFVVQLSLILFEQTFLIAGTALFFAVLGHCFSVYIKFKGGRGLATALGGSVLFVPQIPVLWIILWIIAYVYKKNVHFSNASATFLLILLVLYSGDILAKYSIVKPNTISEFEITTVAVLLVIFIKHIKPLKEYFNKQRIIGDRNE